MPTFTGTSALALTWTADGHCRGLRLSRRGSTCQVVAHWQSEADPNRSVADTLAEGLRELGAAESTVVVAGAEEISSGAIDLDMPELRAAELKNALAFELRRNAPVPDDKLAWAYRVLGKTKKGRQHVRLYYLRQSMWETWLDHVSGLTHGLDMVIPPAAALDPVLAERPVALGSEEDRFVFVPTSPERREAVPGQDEHAEDLFGGGERPLQAEYFEPGPLGQLSAARQRAYTACAVLGMYALTHTFAADRATGLELPYELRPRRNRISRLLAVALLIYTAAIAGFGGLRLYQSRRAEFDSLRVQRSELEKDIERLNGRLKGDEREFLEEVRGEIAAFSEAGPTMAMALADITRRVGHSGWCTAFRWRERSISLQLRETEELDGLEVALEFSPVLGDVRQESKRVRGGIIDRKVEMNARFDFEDEQSRPPPGAERRRPEVDPIDELDLDGNGAADGNTRQPRPEVVPDEQDDNDDKAEDRRRMLIPPPPPPPEFGR